MRACVRAWVEGKLTRGAAPVWQGGGSRSMTPPLFSSPVFLLTRLSFPSFLWGQAARITSGPAPKVTSECAIEDEGLLALLAEEVDAKKKKKPNKKKKKKGGGGGGEAEEGGDDAE